MKTLHLADAAAAQLWQHLPNMKLIQGYTYDFIKTHFDLTEKFTYGAFVTLTPGNKCLPFVIVIARAWTSQRAKTLRST